MNRFEQAQAVRRAAMERAAVMWEKIINDPLPFSPVDIYKSVCAMKGSEFLARIIGQTSFPELIEPIMDFVDETAAISGEGQRSEGTRCTRIFDQEMPLTDE